MGDDTGERGDRARGDPTEGDPATADGDASQYVGAYDKLVRDEIPAVVREDGNSPVARRVDGDERLRYLAAKLIEEATEYRDAVTAADDDVEVAGTAADDDFEVAGTAADDGDEATVALSDGDEVLDELADVHAVLEAILDASDATTADVDARAREKAADRGGFDDGVVLERIEPRGDDGDGDDGDDGDGDDGG
jgi:predicted house-cleaning noncanonical NTP pyrophosphatase (MazG superfamily)